jgi:hypothetical protein
LTFLIPPSMRSCSMFFWPAQSTTCCTVKSR